LVRKDHIEPRTYRAYTRKDIDRIPQLRHLGPDEIVAMKAVSSVLPFRVNPYVVEELIDWRQVPEDPIYQMTFPQEDMLAPQDFRRMEDLVRGNAPELTLRAAAREIQKKLNPHPAGQMELNVPQVDGQPLRRACSTSTARPCCSFPARARPATPTAPTASAGRSSSARTS
jgi:hypothetical protein